MLIKLFRHDPQMDYINRISTSAFWPSISYTLSTTTRPITHPTEYAQADEFHDFEDLLFNTPKEDIPTSDQVSDLAFPLTLFTSSSSSTN